MELKAPYADPAANILIVEDDPEIRDIVADVMRTEGFCVAAAEDAAGDSVVPLTDVEFDLPAHFVQKPRRVLTRDQLFKWTRGRAADPLDRTIDMIVSRLRRKLQAVQPGSNFITTVRNGGYLFTVHVRRET